MQKGDNMDNMNIQQDSNSTEIVIDENLLLMLGYKVIIYTTNENGSIALFVDKDRYSKIYTRLKQTGKLARPDYSCETLYIDYIIVRTKDYMISSENVEVISLPSNAKTTILSYDNGIVTLNRKFGIENIIKNTTAKNNYSIRYGNETVKLIGSYIILKCINNNVIVIKNTSGKVVKHYNKCTLYYDKGPKRIANLIVNDKDSIAIISKSAGLITFDEYLSIFNVKIIDKEFNGDYASILNKELVDCEYTNEYGRKSLGVINTKTLNITTDIGTLTKQHINKDELNKIKALNRHREWEG